MGCSWHRNGKRIKWTRECTIGEEVEAISIDHFSKYVSEQES